jgi:hypothetical protein
MTWDHMQYLIETLGTLALESLRRLEVSQEIFRPKQIKKPDQELNNYKVHQV